MSKIPPAAALGRNGKEHGRLGLGCWSFGGTDWGKQSERDSLSALAAAWDAGITHWDTALDYGQGQSERLCGQFLKGKRDGVFLATKGNVGNKAASIIASLQHSLKNLGTDFIDLYYIHYPRKGLDLRPHMEFLEKEREKGRIGGIGVSNFSIPQMEQIGQAGCIDAHQLGYNLFWRLPEKEIIPYCRKMGIPVVTYSSLALGILTGKFSAAPVFEKGNIRPKSLFFRKEVWPHVHAAAQKLKPLAEESGNLSHHLAIQWLARQTGVEIILVGARNATQVRQNAVALENEAQEKIFKEMYALSDELHLHYPLETNIFQWHP